MKQILRLLVFLSPELASLKAEAEMSIDELLALYAHESEDEEERIEEEEEEEERSQFVAGELHPFSDEANNNMTAHLLDQQGNGEIEGEEEEEARYFLHSKTLIE